MGSRHMIYWRAYVYGNNLYSICGGNSISFRDIRPSRLRREPGELHRILDFANRDLSVLIRHSEMELMNVFEVVQDLLLEVKPSDSQFRGALAPALGTATHQFCHELNNFACSPYDDLISYDCNVKYRARQLRAEELAAGTDPGFVLLPGIQTFADFSRLVDNDECVGFGMDLDTEDEDPKMMDEHFGGDKNAPLLSELRRVFNERSRSQNRTQSQTTRQSGSQSATAATTAATASTSATATTATAATTAATASTSATLSPNDIGLELAVERSMMDVNSSSSAVALAAALGASASVIARQEQQINLARNLSQRTAALTRSADANRITQNYAVRGRGFASKRRT